MTFAIGSRAGERRGSKPPGVFLYAIRLDGNDLRRDPLEVRKATLTSRPGIRFNEHIEGDGPTVFAHACKMGLEGIVSKRKVPFGALARLAQNEEPGGVGGATRGRRGWGK
jgi:ATP-dependent DNA ligase